MAVLFGSTSDDGRSSKIVTPGRPNQRDVDVVEVEADRRPHDPKQNQGNVAVAAVEVLESPPRSNPAVVLIHPTAPTTSLPPPCAAAAPTPVAATPSLPPHQVIPTIKHAPSCGRGRKGTNADLLRLQHHDLRLPAVAASAYGISCSNLHP